MARSVRYRNFVRLGVATLLFLAPHLFLGGLPLLAQSDGSPPSLPVDTTGTDTVRALQPIDTIPPFEPFAPPLGSVRVAREGGRSDLPKEEIPDVLYYSLYEFLRKKLPAYPLSLGVPGQLQTFSYAGADPQGLTYSLNGRPLSGAEGGGYDPGFYSPEFLERAEVLRGAEAAVFGDAGALIGLNLVQPRFNVAGSYTRLVFAHGAGNTTNADLTFSRNVASRTNLALGIRRLTVTGAYPNQNASIWGVRGGLTWRPKGGVTLSLSEHFTDATRGTNGGMTPTSQLFTGIPNAVNDSLDESQLRHDMTLAAQWYPSLADSIISPTTDLARLVRLDGALYYTHAERSFLVREDVVEMPGARKISRDDIVGLRAGALVPLGGPRLHGNLVAELTDSKAGRLHAGGMAEIPLGDALRIFAGGAATRRADRTTLSFFGEGRAAISDSFDLRLTARIFTNDDPTVAPPSGTFSAERSQLLIEAEGDWHSGVSDVKVGGYLRQIASEGTPDGDYTIFGGNLSLRIPIDILIFEQSALLTVAPSNDKRFPLLSSHSELYALFSLFNNNLDLRIGAALDYQTSFAASEYDYVRDLWLYPTDVTREKQLLPMLDGYARARIGSAYIKLALSNILGVEYYSVYRYPIWGRTFQIGITWALID